MRGVVRVVTRARYRNRRKGIISENTVRGYVKVSLESGNELERGRCDVKITIRQFENVVMMLNAER